MEQKGIVLSKVYKPSIITFMISLIGYATLKGMPYAWYIFMVTMVLSGLVAVLINLNVIYRKNNFSLPISISTILLAFGIIAYNDTIIVIGFTGLLLMYLIKSLNSRRKNGLQQVVNLIILAVLISSFLYLLNIGSLASMYFAELFCYIGLEVMGIFHLVSFDRRINEKFDKSKKHWALSVVIIVWVLLSGIYESYIKDVLIEYKYNRLISLAEKNYYINKSSFNKIYNLSKEIGSYKEMSLSDEGALVVQVEDTTMSSEYPIFHFPYSTEVTGYTEIDFLDYNRIKVTDTVSSYTIDSNWAFTVSENDVFLYNALISEYMKWNKNHLDSLKVLLKQLSCNSVSYEQDILELRYWGNFCEKISYIRKDFFYFREPYFFEQDCGELQQNWFWYYDDCGLVDYFGPYYFNRFNLSNGNLFLN